jgi:hypothetical protein
LARTSALTVWVGSRRWPSPSFARRQARPRSDRLPHTLDGRAEVPRDELGLKAHNAISGPLESAVAPLIKAVAEMKQFAWDS